MRNLELGTFPPGMKRSTDAWRRAPGSMKVALQSAADKRPAGHRGIAERGGRVSTFPILRGKYGYAGLRAAYRLLDDGVCANPSGLVVTPVGVMGAIVNLNHPARVVEWHFIQLSVANIVVIGLMILVFVLAIVLPFPGAARRRGESS
jgi:hypothetical protein